MSQLPVKNTFIEAFGAVSETSSAPGPGAGADHRPTSGPHGRSCSQPILLGELGGDRACKPGRGRLGALTCRPAFHLRRAGRDGGLQSSRCTRLDSGICAIFSNITVTSHYQGCRLKCSPSAITITAPVAIAVPCTDGAGFKGFVFAGPRLRIGAAACVVSSVESTRRLSVTRTPEAGDPFGVDRRP